MANGDRFFGPNGASGAVTGTGAAITIPLDFAPQWVQLINSITGASLLWTKGMPDASGLVGGAGSGVTGSNSGGTPVGTVTTSSIDETPAVVAGAGTLAFVPVNISAFYATAAGTPGPLIVIPSPLVPAAGQVAVNFTTGAFTTFAGDAVTAVRTIYQNSGAVFAGAALAGHTHTIGAAGSFVAVGGVTPGSQGFIIGNDASINILGNNIYWNAGR